MITPHKEQFVEEFKPRETPALEVLHERLESCRENHWYSAATALKNIIAKKENRHANHA